MRKSARHKVREPAKRLELSSEVSRARDRTLQRWLTRLAASNPNGSTRAAIQQFESAWRAALPRRRHV